jgi:hypothetical protein
MRWKAPETSSSIVLTARRWRSRLFGVITTSGLRQIGDLRAQQQWK